MEPKVLANLNGTLSTSTTLRKPSPQSLGNRRVTIAVPSQAFEREEGCPPKTPAPTEHIIVAASPDEEDELAGSASPDSFKNPMTPARPNLVTGGANSPTTPYFLHPTQVTQQTCPPKQSQQPLFPLSGRIEDQPDESLRQRLMKARRQSLQFVPKVKSPLSKDFA